MLSEATPILSGALPAFWSLQNKWEKHAQENKEVTMYILEGMEWLNKYHEKASKTQAYVIAMALIHISITLVLIIVTRFL
jgi:hypothetical protein